MNMTHFYSLRTESYSSHQNCLGPGIGGLCHLACEVVQPYLPEIKGIEVHTAGPASVRWPTALLMSLKHL